jgi:hypothetical protein
LAFPDAGFSFSSPVPEWIMPPSSGAPDELSLALVEVFLFPLIDWNVLVLCEGLQARTTARRSSVAIKSPLYDIDIKSPRWWSRALAVF